MYDAILRRAGTLAIRMGVASLLAFMSLAATAQGVVITVTRTGDVAGSCTPTICNLRQAIAAANATAARDTIRFNIPACGTRNINITGPTLHITRPIIIDGTTQPLCGDPIPGDRTSMIEIRGPGVGVTPNGTILHGLVLDAGSSGSQVRGLAINSFSGTGIGISSNNNLIVDNKLGTDPTGRLARPNNIGIGLNNASGNQISSNIISGNESEGINVSADDTLIFDNEIGLNADGDPLGNGGDGISTFDANGTEIGFAASIGNTIVNNGGAGVRIAFGSFNKVLGNNISNNDGLGVVLQGLAANHGQVAPVIIAAVRRVQQVSTVPPLLVFVTTIQGTLANVSGTSFRVDIYGNNACDPSGAGEGQKFIASVPVAANGTFQLSTSTSTGAVITAIGRSPDGDTSQFSTCRTVSAF
jgi:hypothetical protein